MSFISLREVRMFKCENVYFMRGKAMNEIYIFLLHKVVIFMTKICSFL